VRASISDASLIRDIEGLERAASAGVAHAVVNNTHWRDWPLERWLAVLTFAMALTGGIVGAIWMAGGEWAQIQRAVAIVPVLVAGQAETKAELHRIGTAVGQIQDTQQRSLSVVLEATPRPASRPRDPAATFPREEQTFIGRGSP
jgi:hypothetical protein